MSQPADRPRNFFLLVFQSDYVGPVYIQLNAPGETVEGVEVELLWGPWRKRMTLPSVDSDGTALVCAKLKQEEHPLPLRIHTSAELCFSGGQGLPELPGKRVLDCNDGWGACPF